MKNKVRTFIKTRLIECQDGIMRNISVYGELHENDYVDGVALTRVKFTGKGKEIVQEDNVEWLLSVHPDSPTRTKEFYMGFSICSPEDAFSETTAIKISKRRFGKPMRTQNGCFLTSDMIEAILENEIKFIANHIERFLPKE